MARRKKSSPPPDPVARVFDLLDKERDKLQTRRNPLPAIQAGKLFLSTSEAVRLIGESDTDSPELHQQWQAQGQRVAAAILELLDQEGFSDLEPACVKLIQRASRHPFEGDGNVYWGDAIWAVSFWLGRLTVHPLPENHPLVSIARDLEAQIFALADLEAARAGFSDRASYFGALKASMYGRFADDT